jgi:hypothetical protein
LIAELRIGSRFECIGIDYPDYCHIPVKKKNMAVESPSTALRAAGATERDFPDHFGKMINRILKKGVFFLSEGCDTV